MAKPSAWRLALPLTLAVIAAIFVLYFETARSIVDIWVHYETFTHGFIIVPISLWLIWKRRGDLAQLTPQFSGWGLLLLLGIIFIWLLGKLSGTQVVMQYSFAAMFPATVLALLGWRVFRPIAFPLLFILLAVPFGDAFIDPLINVTADITVTGLQFSGIPVLREGNTLTIPTGTWSVVEACSGVRYLIASMTLGIIYAYLTYRSFKRQILFVIASILVPIVANGLRAYMIVMIGHLSNMKYAVGIDHLIYGWLFFGLVMLILFWIGNFWREDNQPPRPQQRTTAVVPEHASAARLMLGGGLMLAAFGMAPWYVATVESHMARQPLPRLSDLAVPGWSRTTAFTDWLPEFKNPALQRMIFLQKDQRPAGVYIAYYRNQNRDNEMIRYGNVLAMPGGKIWHRLSETWRVIPGMAFQVRENMLGRGQERLLAWYWYWDGDRFTTNAYLAKANLALSRLRMRADDSAVIAVFAPYKERPEEAIPALQQLAQALLPDLGKQFTAARQH